MDTPAALQRLRALIDRDDSAAHLRARSPHRQDVEALQHLLHVLGYDRQLNWERFGADGDYGDGTASAVRAFVSGLDLPLDGSHVPTSLASLLVDAVERQHDTEAAGSPDDPPTATAPDLGRGSTGDAVVDLQLRLAGFRGTVWDGDFGPGTELQVRAFQRDYMQMDAPTGVVDAATHAALSRFAGEFPVDFNALRCPCEVCPGFGQGRFEGEYRDGRPHVEAYHRREYPGIHKAILHACRAACFYLAREGLGQAIITSGYRCWVRNEQRGRTSTNHMGKAIDIDVPLRDGEDKRDDQRRCDRARAVLVDKCGFQIGWDAGNRKALEPGHIAPTWVHMDVRCYGAGYLETGYFVESEGELDGVGGGG